MAPFSNTDKAYMQMALTLAARGRGRTFPNPMVGAVVVREGRVVGRGFHVRAGEAHAEPIALREAGELAQDAALYVNLEPCIHHGRTPPCVDAIVEAGIQRVVAAMQDPNSLVVGRGFEALRQAGVQVEVGCLEPQARKLNEYYVVFHEQNRPFVTLKWAMSLCGRTAHDTGQSRWISNKLSRQQVHRLRADHNAVLVGIGTILADDPMLNVRLEGYEGPQPHKVVIDGDLSIPTRARLLRERGGGEIILFTTTQAKPELIDYFRREQCEVVVIPSRRRVMDMHQILFKLREMGVMSVFCEGGRQIHTSLLKHRLADKVIAFLAPKIIGGKILRTPVEDLGIPDIANSIDLQDVSCQHFGDDLCFEGYLRRL